MKSLFKIVFLIVLLSILSIMPGIYAQDAPEYLWARQFGALGYSWYTTTFDIAVDSQGNAYITGCFENTAYFGGVGQPGSAELVSRGSIDIFLVKYDSEGNFLWVKHIGGGEPDYSESVALDDSDNVYLSGYFEGTIYFGEPGNPGTEVFASKGFRDIFVSKLDPDGNYLWIKQAGGIGSDAVRAIAADISGYSYITGYFYATIYFGDPEDPDTIELTASGNGYDCNAYFARLDPEGNFLWARPAGTDMSITWVEPYGIDADSYGNSYVTGFFNNTVCFGYPEDPDAIPMTAYGIQDVFIAKIDPDGRFLWVKQGGVYDDYSSGKDIAVDDMGNSFITGHFIGLIFFGSPGQPGTISLESRGSFDAFIAKLDPEGNFLWANQAGGHNDDYGRGIALDDSGNCYATGHFRNYSTFGKPGDINQIKILARGYIDVYIAKIDPAGNFIWANQAGGTYTTGCSGIAVDNSGNSYISGGFQEITYFGEPGEPGTYEFDWEDGGEFIAKMDAGTDGADAAVSADEIGYFPENPLPGDTVEISARIRNIGNELLLSGIVSFYHSLQPNTNLQLIGSVPCGEIQPGEYEDIEILWDTDGSMDPRAYIITVEVTDTEPNDINVINNRAFREILLPVELESFSARGVSGNVSIRWRTVSEADNLGFNLFRVKAGKTGPFVSIIPVKLNNGIIPGQGSSSSPHDYSFTDSVKDKGDYFYLLESISTGGTVSDTYRTRLEWIF